MAKNFILRYIEEHKEIKIKDIQHLTFSYSVGYAMNANYLYDILCDEICNVKIKPNGIAEDDAYKFTISSKIMDEVYDLLIKYQVGKWNGFHKVDKHVLDGNSFSLSIKMKNGDILSASGYMKYPKNYKNVKEGFLKIFEKYIS